MTPAVEIAEHPLEMARRRIVEDGAIVPVEEGAARKLMKYKPWWVQALAPEGG